MNELALFAGAGGGILGGKLLGWNTIGAVEIEEYPRKVLLQRQRDGILGKFPIWDDITTFDGRLWEGAVDIISGGFPCQDISSAGKGEGIEGSRSGLWKDMFRVVDEIRPRFVFVENSPMLTSRGLGTVLGDLAKMGYNARWCVLGADDAGAWHKRKRIWILAYTSSSTDSTIERQKRKENSLSEKYGQARCSGWSSGTGFNTEVLANPNKNNVQRKLGGIDGPEERKEQRKRQAGFCRGTGDWGEAESELGRVADGVANRSHRLKAIGNGQVPSVAAIAFTILSEGLI